MFLALFMITKIIFYSLISCVRESMSSEIQKKGIMILYNHMNNFKLEPQSPCNFFLIIIIIIIIIILFFYMFLSFFLIFCTTFPNAINKIIDIP